MSAKIKNYIEVLFSDVPRTKKSVELKEEMLSNMTDRYNDYVAEGKSENQAYSLVVANLGDIDEMLAEVMPTESDKKQADFYRVRNAKNITIAVVLYILSPFSLIAISEIGGAFISGVDMGTVGVLVMFLLIAIATGILVYNSMSMPKEFKTPDEDDAFSQKLSKTPEGRKLKAAMNIYWSIITILYFCISFLSGAWSITWIIFLIAGVLDSIIKTIYEIKTVDDY